jgi:3-hydroxymyristoyl/3-hydroxydecanoyl-(acyl carrier protein) dehydratase
MNPIDSLKNEKGEIEEENIKKIIPYQHPFLFVEKVLYLDRKKITAIKNISKKEEYLKGHFVNFPIMPGALIIEGLGQAGTLLVRYNLEGHEKRDILAYQIKNAKFKYPSFPGQQLKYEVELKRLKEKGALLKGKVFLDNDPRPVAECKFIVAIVDRESFRNKFKEKAVLD